MVYSNFPFTLVSIVVDGQEVVDSVVQRPIRLEVITQCMVTMTTLVLEWLHPQSQVVY